jgi:UDP-N-acetylglucosamine 2-epimerase (non-hydrolysing)
MLVARFVRLFSEPGFLWKDAALVLTDSGHLQEETTVLGIPRLALRENTERPIPIEQGTNTFAGATPESIHSAYETAITDFSSRQFSVIKPLT